MSSITLGTDPELFVLLGGQKEVIPAYHALGKRDIDLPLPYGILQPDGLAVEFTVTPSENASELVRRIGANLRAIPSHLIDDVTLSCAATATVSWDYIKELTPDFGNRCSLQIFGCSPDYRVYALPEVERPDPRTIDFRSAGGHIHLGMGQEFVNSRLAVTCLTALLDATIGCAITAISHSEEAKLRKILYGAAGYVRTNLDKGLLEYRVLPAQAILHDGELAFSVFKSAQDVASWVLNMFEDNSLQVAMSVIGDWKKAALAIDTHNQELCKAIAKRTASIIGLEDFYIDYFNLDENSHTIQVDTFGDAE